MFTCDFRKESRFIKSLFNDTTNYVGTIELPVVDKEASEVNRIAYIPYSAFSLRTCYVDGRSFDEEYGLVNLYADNNMVNLEALEEIASREEE